MNQCNEPDHGAINAERAESRGLRKAWVELDDKRQDLEKQLSTITEQRDRLAEALRDVMKYRKGEEPYDYWRLSENQRGNAQFDGWHEIEDRINEALAAVEGGSDE